MKYPAPQQPSTTKEIEALVKSIERYQNGTIQMRDKLGKMKAMRRKITEDNRRNEVLVSTTKEDATLATEKLNDMKQKLKDFDMLLHTKGKTFQNDMFALEELKEGIQKQTEEVKGRIAGLTTACQDWKFANQLSNDICSSSRSHAFGSFNRWALIQPLLRIWMATDSQIHRTTYATAQFEGVYEELMAHFEVKDAIEQFGEDHYAVYKETEDLVRTVKQATEERHMRSLLMDQQHMVASRKLQKLVNSCKVLKKEIEQREMLRFKLNGLMMELSNALEGDLRGAMEVCEKEATKPTAVTVADMRLAVDAGVLSGPYAVTTSATGAAAGAGAGAGGSNDVAVGKVGSGKNSSKVVVSPGKDVAAHTEKNTVLNSVSKLPLLIKKTSEHSHQSSNHSSEHSTSTTGSAGEGEHSAAGEHPVAGNIYAQLPQYDGQAMAYVRSFNAPKRTKTWKWCKSSAQDVNAMVQGMFPVVRGPVDLVVTQPDNPRASAQSNNNNGTSGNTKTPAVPSFRRRVGHSSKNPFAGPLNSNPNYFSRERASVGSPGMPVGWLKSGGGGGSEEGDRDGGDGDNVGERVGSPTETAEDARKRALKFMLSDRETHYDLMHREVVDAVTMQQMDQARMAAAARRRAEAEAAQMSPAALAEAELHTHQYRAHQLLKDDYSSKRTGGRSGRSGRIGGAGLEGDEDDEEEESEEYSLYVSLPEMSAHSALTARQAIRTMQNASAGITFETISKISEVLKEATDAAKTSRAGTAVDARRGSLGLQSRVSPPHTPKSPSGGAAGIAGTGVDGTGADGTGSPGSRFHFRQYQYSGALGSSGGTFSRTRISSQAHPVEETLEVQTAAALDNIPVEAQAQDLNEKAAAQFRAAREKVEDWIETHVQCNYKSTKRSLLELISNLDLGLNTGEDGDSDGFGYFSDREESSQQLEGANGAGTFSGTGGLGSTKSDAAMMAFGPGSMNFTLKNMLEMSRNLIGSIQQNLKEFAERSNDVSTPDFNGDHRRPNSGGVLSSLAFNTATSEEVYIECDEEEERPFDPEDYAFNRHRIMSGTPHSPGRPGGATLGTATLENGGNGSPSSSYKGEGGGGLGSPGRSGKVKMTSSQSNQSNLAALVQQYGQLSNTGWPARRCVLHSMESIICGELFVVEYIWVPLKMNTELVAKQYVNKSEFHEYRFTVSPHMISDLTNTPRDLALHTLFHDTAKVTQTIIGSLTKETVDTRFYAEIVRAFRHHSAGTFQPHWPAMVIEEMLHPKNIVSRRGSIGQLYRSGSSEKNRLSTPEMRMHKRMAEAAEEAVATSTQQQQREYEYLMQVLTVRKKQGDLLAYSFPTLHTIAPEAFSVKSTTGTS